MTEQQERLVAHLPLPDDFSIIESGHYIYSLNGSSIKVIEPWFKALNSQGQTLIHSARFADDYGINILVRHQTGLSSKETANNGNYDFSTYISWQQQNQADIYAVYRYSAKQQQLHSQITSNEPPFSSHDQRQDKFLFFPLLRVFSGDIIHSLESFGPLTTVVPDIRTPQNRQSLLHCTESLRSAKKLAEEPLQIANQEYKSNRYTYLSERYQSEDEATFWLSAQGLLLKYCWQQNAEQFWEIELQGHQLFNKTV